MLQPTLYLSSYSGESRESPQASQTSYPVDSKQFVKFFAKHKASSTNIWFDEVFMEGHEPVQSTDDFVDHTEIVMERLEAAGVVAPEEGWFVRFYD